MPKLPPPLSVAGILAALSIVLAVLAPAHATELEPTAALEVQAVRALDTSRQIDGLEAATIVVLADGTRLAAGSAITPGDRIVSGTVQNVHSESLALALGDGTLTLLVPGEQISFAAGEVTFSSHECVCQCTCSGEKFTVDADCDGSADCSALNGEDCLVFVDGELKEGTASDCSFKIIPKVSISISAASTTTQ